MHVRALPHALTGAQNCPESRRFPHSYFIGKETEMEIEQLGEVLQLKGYGTRTPGPVGLYLRVKALLQSG